MPLPHRLEWNLQPERYEAVMHDSDWMDKALRELNCEGNDWMSELSDDG